MRKNYPFGSWRDRGFGAGFVGTFGDQAIVMRGGVRARLRSVGDRLRGMTPSGLVAVLCAGAFGPVVGVIAGVTGAAQVAAVGVLGSVGANVLTEVVSQSIDRLRSQQPSQEEFEHELAERVEEVLAGDGTRARLLRSEIAAVFSEIGAVGAAVEAAVETGNQELQVQLAAGLAAVGDEFDEFAFLLTEARDASIAIRDTLRRQDAEHHADRARSRRQSTQLALVLEKISTIERSAANTPGAASVVVSWPEAPYRGLYPFEEDHSKIFYGREKLTAELMGRLAERLDCPGLVVVTGASGAGKSSLLRAGLLPALARGVQLPGSAAWPSLQFTPTRSPMEELAVHLANLNGSDPAAIARSLVERPGETYQTTRQILLSQGAAKRVVLVVDQFEEIFTLVDNDAQRQSFITALHVAATRRVGPDDEPAALVVLGVRGDFWDRCSTFPELAHALEEGQFIVGPMSEPELRRAITGPAESAGLTTEAALVETVLADLRADKHKAGTLPLLSQAMLRTWENREDNQLTLRGYGIGGGIAQAVRSSAEAAYNSLTPRQQDLARTVFRQLVTVSSGEPRLRRAERGELAADSRGDLAAVLDEFAAKRLIVLNDNTCEIAHAALLDAWPRLRSWLEPDLAEHRLFSQFLDDADEWDRRQRDPSFLYRGTRLESIRQIESHLHNTPHRYPDLAGTPRIFLDTSIRAATLSKRLRQAAAGGVAVLAVIAVFAASIAMRTAQTANRQRAIAVSRQLASQSQALADTQTNLSALLAAAAWRIAPTPEARNSINTVLAQPRRGILTGHGDAVYSVAFSPDGNILASASNDQTVRLWDVATRRQLSQPLSGHKGDIRSVAFSPDGRILASASSDQTVRLWDLTTRRQLGAPLAGHNHGVSSVAFSPDGQTLATAGRDRMVRLWDVVTRSQLGAPIAGHKDSVADVRFSPDGKTLATAGADRSVRLWDVASRRQRGEPLTGHRYGVNAVAFSPDGRTLASAGDNDSIRLWDVATHHQLGAPLGGSDSVAFSPDGKTLASGAVGPIELWDITTRRQIGAPLTGHTRGVSSVTFSPDGKTLASASEDGTVRLWGTATRRQQGKPLPAQEFGGSVAFSPDGKTLAFASDDDTVRLWDLATRRQRGKPLATPTHEANSVVFSPDGKTLASTYDSTMLLWDVASQKPLPGRTLGHNAVAFSPDGKTIATDDHVLIMVRLWDIATRRQRGAPLAGHNDDILSLAFSPDGKTIASAGRDLTVRLWDVATHSQLGAPIAGHKDYLAEMRFSPNGKTLATAGDRAVRIWDVATRRQLGPPLAGHTGLVNSVAYSPDGNILASASSDHTIRLWNMSTPTDPLTTICAIPGRSLTPQEWKQYVPSEEYRAICP